MHAFDHTPRGGGQHDHFDRTKRRLLLDIFQNLHPCQIGQFQVEENDVGKWMLRAVGIFTIAIKILDRLFAVAHKAQRQL